MASKYKILAIKKENYKIKMVKNIRKGHVKVAFETRKSDINV